MARENREKSSNLRPLLRLAPFVAGYWRHIAAALAALVLASAAMLAIPLAVRRVLDNGFTSGNPDFINRYFAFMLIVVAVLAVASALRMYFVVWIGERLVADLRDHLFRHLTLLPPSFYETQRTGEVVSRLTADTTLLKAAFSTTASIALRNAILLVGAIVMMIYTSPRLAGLSALAIPLIVIPLILYGRKVRNLSRAAQDALAKSAAFAQERLAAIATVQSNTQEALTNQSFREATLFAFEAANKRTMARGFLTFAIILIAMGAIVLLLWYGARDVLAGNLSGGTLSQFVLYAVFAGSSLSQLSEVWGEVQSAAGAAERISELLDEKPAIASPAIPQSPKPSASTSIAFKKVDFTYPQRPHAKVLNGVSFTANAGEVVAIVGPSGAGKTTVFTLLQRFHDVDQGQILVSGLPVHEFDLEKLRSLIATVPQDPVIFSSTIAENISFGRPRATRADIEAAALKARVTEFASALPKGLDTELGERGITLSGGQRQRVAIARAILRDAPILLLDEATSALDAESEALIQDALQQLTKGRTTLVIAHRLATVRKADKIILMDKGKVLAQGTHSQLMKKSALYARLAKLQFDMKV